VGYKEGNGAALDPHPMGVDPDAARAEAGRLFDAAGFTGGETLKLDILPERLHAPATAQLIQQEVAAFGIETEITPREYTEMITLQTTGTFDHMILGFGNWIKPGSTAVTVLFSDAYDGRMNAPADENVPVRERLGIADEPEWTDMVQQAIDGTWTDWQAWNEKYLDVAWSNVQFRGYSVGFRAKNLEISSVDANGWPYAPGTRFAT
jgi:ABC-type transport system substrate-binding protein